MITSAAREWNAFEGQKVVDWIFAHDGVVCSEENCPGRRIRETIDEFMYGVLFSTTYMVSEVHTNTLPVPQKTIRGEITGEELYLVIQSIAGKSWKKWSSTDIDSLVDALSGTDIFIKILTFKGDSVLT